MMRGASSCFDDADDNIDCSFCFNVGAWLDTRWSQGLEEFSIDGMRYGVCK